MVVVPPISHYRFEHLMAFAATIDVFLHIGRVFNFHNTAITRPIHDISISFQANSALLKSLRKTVLLFGSGPLSQPAPLFVVIICTRLQCAWLCCVALLYAQPMVGT